MVRFRSCLFFNNSVTIVMESHHSQLELTCSTFDSNLAKNQMFLDNGGTGKISGSSFVNIPDALNPFLACDIVVSNSPLVVENTLFFNASGLTSSCLVCLSDLVVANCTFSAVPVGVSVNQNVTVLASTFFGVSQGIIQSEGNLQVSGCTFRNGSQGINVLGGSASITDSVFTGHNIPVACSFPETQTQIERCGFLNNQGAVTTSCHATIVESNFTSNTGLIGGGVWVAGGALLVVSSRFEGNSATDGGALFTSVLFWTTSSVTMVNSSFVANRASGNGGAVLDTASVFTCIDCLFDSNHADGSGGATAHFKKGLSTSFVGTRFVNNSAAFGGAVLAQAPELSQMAAINSTFVGNSADNGGALFFGEGSNVTLGSCEFQRNTASQLGNTVAVFISIPNDCSIYGAALSFTGCDIDDGTSNSISTGGNGVSLQFSDCVIGGREVESLHDSQTCPPGSYSSNTATECFPCLPGSYLFETNSSNGCLKCEGASGNLLCARSDNSEMIPAYIISEGYYPSPDARNPIGLVPCGVNFDGTPCRQLTCHQTCSGVEGGTCETKCTNTSGACREGYDSSSRLCSRCECTGSGCWYWTETGCHKCVTAPMYVMVAVPALHVLAVIVLCLGSQRPVLKTLFVVALMVAISFMGVGHWWYVEMIMYVNTLTTLVMTKQEPKQEPSTAMGIFKLFTFFIQMSLSLGSFRLPNSEGGFSLGFEMVNLQLTGLECAYGGSISRPARFLLAMAMPIFLVATALVLLVFRHFVARLRARAQNIWESWRRQEEDQDQLVEMKEPGVTQAKFTQAQLLVHVILFVLLFCYLEVATRIFDVFDCSPDPFSKKLYLHTLPWFECGGTEYTKLVTIALVSFVAFTLGIPACFGYLLFKHRNQIKSGEEAVHYWLGFFYEEYKKEFFWFELVWIARRVLLAACVAFSWWLGNFQNILIVAVLLTFLMVHWYTQPFKSPVLNALEVLSTFVILVTRTAVSQGDRTDAVSQRFSFALTVLASLGFLGLFSFRLAKKIKTKLIKKFKRTEVDWALDIEGVE